MPIVSADALRLYGYLPQFVLDADAANGYTLLLWLDGSCAQLQVIDSLVRDQGSNPGWSVLFDLARCPDQYLPWLAQFVGTRFNSQVLSGTFPAADAQKRAAIANPIGWGRGSIRTFTTVAQPFLGGSGTVTILERTPYPYSLTIVVTGVINLTYADLSSTYATYADVDAAFPTYADTSSNEVGVTAALESVLPAGLILTISFGRVYSEIDADYADYDILDAAFPSYADVH